MAVAAFPPMESPAAVPVMLVPTRAVGVPRAGVTSVGEVASTTAPEPVVVAAEIAVPFPARTGAFTVVERVMAGVVVGLATEPASPLAVTTDTEVTVPDPEAVSTRMRPVTWSIWPERTSPGVVELSKPAEVM